LRAHGRGFRWNLGCSSPFRLAPRFLLPSLFLEVRPLV
jgi:hypothetical protein